MCGRYASTRSAEDLVAEFDAADGTGGALPAPDYPDYNVAPTKQVYVVRRSRRTPGAEEAADDAEARRVLSVVRWGLVPSWARDASVGSRMLNARAESLVDKPAFRAAFARRRCLVPADGWYEWAPRANAPGKQPYFMTPADGGGLAFAGLWEVWGRGDERLYTCTVVTTSALGPLAGVHDRMPLVLPPERWAAWLGEEPEVEPVTLLAPPPVELLAGLEIRPVAKSVGDVRNNGAALVAPVGESAEPDLDVPTLF